jgi:hypothetical protein
MPVELVNKDPRYSKVHLIDPARWDISTSQRR